MDFAVGPDMYVCMEIKKLLNPIECDDMENFQNETKPKLKGTPRTKLCKKVQAQVPRVV